MKNKSSSFWKKLFSPKTLFAFAISILGLYFGFRKFDSAEFLNYLRLTNLWIFGLSMAVMIFLVVLRGWRWKYLILPISDLPVKQVFEMEMIGYFGNHVFPFRLGEILRAYALSKTRNLPVSAIFGTIVLERTLDVLTFVIVLISGAIFFPGMPSWVRTSGLISGLIVLILLILLYISKLNKVALKRFFMQKIKMSDNSKISKTIKSFWQGLTTLQQTPHLGLIIFQSLLIWTINIGNFWLMGASLQVYFNLSALLLIFFVTSAIISVPSAPGYVGTYHAATIGILVFLGLELSKAQAVAVIMHAVGFISLTALGLVYFLKYQLNFKSTVEVYVEKGA
ncbi:MAG TPA: lysylphosphatidylglycerol synthase transmembrane domain-containing protein [Candidatus Marinimicrobia bacterium]|nr:lysylphosphatidylglycerol synthase transmembrane domain-containing protein [Candidatus Neomarinimicrobiota bacterium]HRS51839.1 lysylphosphatidylglycerol synthase transmembrane domain-containing protein [Candidatus Neomarinimicrobiota bacterium]HRU92700.1 lysylphosphatidylglycerol synthase transmembrane domain-containing protein [Candidatus Neomarinimicrobiota bacterium]